MIRHWSTINIRWRIAAIALLAAIILPVAWYLGSPLFINVTLNEGFPDAVRSLRPLEPCKVQNGPDLYVYLSGHPMPRSSAQLHEHGTCEVARLKGLTGDQNYELPADLDLSQDRAVVIYCRYFSAIFSTAELLTVQH